MKDNKEVTHEQNYQFIISDSQKENRITDNMKDNKEETEPPTKAKGVQVVISPKTAAWWCKVLGISTKTLENTKISMSKMKRAIVILRPRMKIQHSPPQVLPLVWMALTRKQIAITRCKKDGKNKSIGKKCLHKSTGKKSLNKPTGKKSLKRSMKSTGARSASHFPTHFKSRRKILTMI